MISENSKKTAFLHNLAINHHHLMYLYNEIMGNESNKLKTFFDKCAKNMAHIANLYRFLI